MTTHSGYTKPTHTKESIKASSTKSPFGYYGAKLRLASQIVGRLPPHNAWVEGFCGSAAITLAKPPAPIEVINDLDGQIVNLFRQLRIRSEDLCRAVALTPYAKEEFDLARTREKGLDPLERARRFLVATMMTVNATIGTKRSGFSYSQSYSREGHEARVNRWCNLPERLASSVARLKGVRVERRDACELIRMFADRPATLIYLDPPYFTKREHEYVIDARDQEFHERLLTECQRARCMIILSGYESEIYDGMLTEARGWSKSSIETHTRDTTGKDYSRVEILWTNRVFQRAHTLGKVPLRLTKREIAERKINPVRKR